MVDDVDTLLIWKVVEGPFHVSDLPDGLQEVYPDFYPPYWLEVMVSPSSTPEEYFYDSLYLNTFDECYQFMQHVDKKMEPIKMDIKTGEYT